MKNGRINIDPGVYAKTNGLHLLVKDRQAVYEIMRDNGVTEHVARQFWSKVKRCLRED